MHGQGEHESPAPTIIAEVFDAGATGRLSADVLDRAAAELIATHPTAPVGALTEAGLFVDMPASIALAKNPVLKGRTGMDGATGPDREHLLANWDRVLKRGAGRCLIHPSAYGATVMHGLDLRERHGVVFVLLIAGAAGDADAGEGAAVEPEPSLPRFATVAKDQFATITRIDEATAAILGWSPEEMTGRRTLDFIHPEDRALAIDNWMQMLAQPGPARRVRQRMRRKDGAWVWFEVTNHNLLMDPEHGCVVCEMVDISEEMAAHEEVRAREQLLDRLAETLPVGLLQIDEHGGIVYTNDRLHEILGTQPCKTAAEQLTTLLAADRRLAAAALRQVLADGTGGEVEVTLQRPGDAGLRVCTISLRGLTHEDGSVSGAIACVTDVTDGTRMREELRRRATTDELTGAYNRAAIMRALEEHVASGQRHAERAVMFIDLDEFKEINDRHGHAAGDELLRTVAAALREAVREGDLVGRVGGDEFILLCPAVGGPDGAERLGERVRERLDGVIAASVGVAWSEGERVGADELIASADRAMYANKRLRAAALRVA